MQITLEKQFVGSMKDETWFVRCLHAILSIIFNPRTGVSNRRILLCTTDVTVKQQDRYLRLGAAVCADFGLDAVYFPVTGTCPSNAILTMLNSQLVYYPFDVAINLRLGVLKTSLLRDTVPRMFYSRQPAQIQVSLHRVEEITLLTPQLPLDSLIGEMSYVVPAELVSKPLPRLNKARLGERTAGSYSTLKKTKLCVVSPIHAYQLYIEQVVTLNGRMPETVKTLPVETDSDGRVIGFWTVQSVGLGGLNYHTGSDIPEGIGIDPLTAAMTTQLQSSIQVDPKTKLLPTSIIATIVRRRLSHNQLRTITISNDSHFLRLDNIPTEDIWALLIKHVGHLKLERISSYAQTIASSRSPLAVLRSQSTKVHILDSWEECLGYARRGDVDFAGSHDFQAAFRHNEVANAWIVFFALVSILSRYPEKSLYNLLQELWAEHGRYFRRWWEFVFRDSAAMNEFVHSYISQITGENNCNTGDFKIDNSSYVVNIGANPLVGTQIVFTASGLTLSVFLDVHCIDFTTEPARAVEGFEPYLIALAKLYALKRERIF